ncbi:hypothetical protein HDU76_012092, partial [Blyttiomyces sp. JEL0837]
MSGPIPDWIADLPLTELSLPHNRFTGSIPPSFAKLKNLTRLDLSENQLSGIVPQFIWELTTLQQILLNNNYALEGQIPESFGNNKGLTEVMLRWNNFTGPFPKSVWNISTLEQIDISNNRFTGTFPNVIANMPREFAYNNFEGRMPRFVNVPLLRTLIGSNNLLVGDVPPELGSSFPNLGTL